MELNEARHKHAMAWLAMALSLGVHVADEAAHDFLSVYNPSVMAIRERLPWLPLPVFRFEMWLTGLIAGVVLLLALTPLVRRGVKWLRPASYALGALMFANGLGHFAGTLRMGAPMPGVYSSPLLIWCSAWLLMAARRTRAGNG